METVGTVLTAIRMRKLSQEEKDKQGMFIALVGNPNSGKTTLFNQLTGANQHVGNFPGVTVEKKEAVIRDVGQYQPKRDTGHITLVDLPGIYSLSPYSIEEIVSRNYVIKEKPDAIINIVDVMNIRWYGHILDTHPCTGLVQDINRLIRQKTVTDITHGQTDCRFDCFVTDFNIMIFFIPASQSL